MRRDESQRTWENTQKQYANLTALIPLLTSNNPAQVSTGLEIYSSEAKVGQAPLDLQNTIRRIGNDQPQQTGAAQAALEASKIQMAAECKSNPDGVYVHVANSTEQLKRGQLLATFLRNAGFKVEGVQRVDAVPNHAQLRFYFSDANSAQASKIGEVLRSHGVTIDEQDLSPRYLKQGCPPPGVFELWIGSDTPLAVDGSVTK